MISHLYIKDFAIIEETQVSFTPCLNMITGETGAGKSIVIEAISLALGGRADSAYIRTGAEQAIVELILEDCNNKALDFLEENQIPVDEGQIIIRRELNSKGKSLCKINNRNVPVSLLKSLCENLVDIHGQYDHQALLNPDLHIDFLDMYDASAIKEAKAPVSKLFSEYKALTSKLASIERNASENARKLDFMAFELAEIQEANPILHEDEELKKQILMLQNSEKIYGNLSFVYDSMYESSPSVMEALGKAQQSLSEIAPYSEEISSLLKDFTDSYYTIENICMELRVLRDGVTYSPKELDSAILRLDILDKLKYKYGGSIEAVLEYKEKLLSDLEVLEDVSGSKDKLQEQIAICETNLKSACESLRSLRRNISTVLETKISEQLLDLSFANAEFKIEIKDDPQGYSENGMDCVEFLISPNKGEPVKPLSKIASGGEMSRIMLAFKKILGDYDNIPTFIFDEIDSGISGIAASVVGRKLKEISTNHQIICITHLPQIAACGYSSYKLFKETTKNSTRTNIIKLNDEDKTMEIARLLGGLNVTDSTIESAKELISASS